VEKPIVDLVLGGDCCVECAAKRAYNRLVLDIMEAEDAPGPDVEARLDLLLDFLKHADFGALRSSDERLAGEIDARCRLYRGADGAPSVSIIEADEE